MLLAMLNEKIFEIITLTMKLTDKSKINFGLISYKIFHIFIINNYSCVII